MDKKQTQKQLQNNILGKLSYDIINEQEAVINIQIQINKEEFH